jgi:hypothetical protein
VLSTLVESAAAGFCKSEPHTAISPEAEITGSLLVQPPCIPATISKMKMKDFINPIRYHKAARSSPKG